MKLLLKRNVPNLGSLGQIVEVARGHGRNYLLPQGFAIEVTHANLQWFEAQKRRLIQQEEETKAPGPPSSAVVSTATPPPSSIPVDENLGLLRDVHMKVKVELGRGRMYLKDILRLGQGSVVELEKLAGDPLDIYVNEKVIARGEVLVLNENFCIRITEICTPAELISKDA